VGSFYDPEIEGNYTLYNISICSSIVKDIYPEHFDDCGMIVPGERGNVCEGDDTVVPSEHWGTGIEGVLAFLNDDMGGKPPLFTNSDEEHFQVVVRDTLFYYTIILMSFGHTLCKYNVFVNIYLFSLYLSVFVCLCHLLTHTLSSSLYLSLPLMQIDDIDCYDFESKGQRLAALPWTLLVAMFMMFSCSYFL
jgi:hypothetical protein